MGLAESAARSLAAARSSARIDRPEMRRRRALGNLAQHRSWKGAYYRIAVGEFPDAEAMRAGRRFSCGIAIAR